MPELTQSAAHEFWRNFNDPSIYSVIAFMEGMEEWTLDEHPDVRAALDKLGDTLDNVGEVELNEEEYFIKIVAHLKTGLGLRLLMALDQAYPGAAAKVLMFAENRQAKDTKIADIFLQRNTVFERLRLLSRIFSKERFKIICKALEESGFD